jgi:hypothetical protein
MLVAIAAFSTLAVPSSCWITLGGRTWSFG